MVTISLLRNAVDAMSRPENDEVQRTAAMEYCGSSRRGYGRFQVFAGDAGGAAESGTLKI